MATTDENGRIVADRRERVVFDLDGYEVEVYHKDGVLHLYVESAAMIVRPVAGNCINITAEK